MNKFSASCGKKHTLEIEYGFSTLFDASPAAGGQYGFIQLLVVEDPKNRPRAAVTFCVDKSSSMDDKYGRASDRPPTRLDLVRRGVQKVVFQDASKLPPELQECYPVLKDNDTVAIVTFEGHSRVVLHPKRIRDGAEAAANKAMEGVHSGGSTSIASCLICASKLIADNAEIMHAEDAIMDTSDPCPGGDTHNFVILLTDGEDMHHMGEAVAAAHKIFTENPLIEKSALVAAVERVLRAKADKYKITHRDINRHIPDLIAGLEGILVKVPRLTFIGVMIGKDADSWLVNNLCNLAGGVALYASEGEGDYIMDAVAGIATALTHAVRENVSVISNSGELTVLPFPIPDTRKGDVTAHIEVLVNGTVVYKEDRVIPAAPAGTVPRCNIACLVPTLRAMMADAKRAVATAISEGKNNEEAKLPLTLLLQAAARIRADYLAAPPAAAAPPRRQATEEDEDMVLVAVGGEEEGDPLRAEALAECDNVMKEAEEEKAKLTKADGDTLRGIESRHLTEANDCARGGTSRGGSVESRRMVSCMLALGEIKE